MKRVVTIIGFILLHLFITMCLFAILFSRGMSAFDKGNADATLFDSIVGHTLLNLWFPFYPIAWSWNVPSGSVYEWALLFSTSAIWGSAIYLFVRFIASRRARRATALGMI